MLQESPVAFERRNDVVDDHLGVVVVEDGAEVEPGADVRNVDDERGIARGYDPRFQQLDDIRVGVDDGDDRLSHVTKRSQACCRAAPTVEPE